jgi:pyruvate formate lyase activating enzyme
MMLPQSSILDPQRTAGGPTASAIQEGVITDIQRYSLHDGPGLRTNVFLKGCSLQCAWCANPETQQVRPEVAVFAGSCIRCGQFDPPCPDSWPVQGDTVWRSRLQREYGRRAAVCPGGGIQWMGEWRTAASVIDEVRRDALFYEDGGGMTLTGGEPALQPEFAEALLRLARDEGIHTAIETCGHVPWPNLARLLPFLDRVLYDVKHIDSALHRFFTGASNEQILGNLRLLAASGVPIVVRVPLIPGFNASGESLRAIGGCVAELPVSVEQVDLLPYHALGRAKYAALARPYSWERAAPLTEHEVDELADVLREMGFAVAVGG